MSKIKNDGLHQYGAEPFEQQQSGTAGAEGVNSSNNSSGGGGVCIGVVVAVVV